MIKEDKMARETYSSTEKSTTMQLIIVQRKYQEKNFLR